MELNEKWKEQAENEFHYEMHKTGFIKGAQTYADAVEKMLIEKHDRESHIRKSTEISKIWDKANDKINIIEELLFELKLIQP